MLLNIIQRIGKWWRGAPSQVQSLIKLEGPITPIIAVRVFPNNPSILKAAAQLAPEVLKYANASQLAKCINRDGTM